MDLKIKSSEKQTREATIKARDDKQAAKKRRAMKRHAKREAVVERRLRRRINREVRKDLQTEKRCYLKGKTTGDEFFINTKIRYKGVTYLRRESFVKKLLDEALAKHSGFEYEVEFVTKYGAEGCSKVRIWYTLLEQ